MKKINVVALVGKAGAGKDYYLRQVCEHADVHEIISCTTRPVRDGELDGVNYHYLSDEQFLAGNYIECCMFRGWRYGTRISDLDPNKINVGVFNLAGVEQLLTNENIDLTVIQVTATDKVRLIRQLNREFDPDVNEIMRRFKTDEEDFNEDRLINIQQALPDKFYWISNNSNDYDGTIFNVNRIIEIIKANRI